VSRQCLVKHRVGLIYDGLYDQEGRDGGGVCEMQLIYVLNVAVSWQLDKELRGCWDDAMSRGYFRYQLKHVQTRIVPGKYQFVLQV